MQLKTWKDPERSKLLCVLQLTTNPQLSLEQPHPHQALPPCHNLQGWVIINNPEWGGWAGRASCKAAEVQTLLPEKKSDGNKNEILNTPSSLSSKVYCTKLLWGAEFCSDIYIPTRKKKTNAFRRVNAAVLKVSSSQIWQKWAKKYPHLL